MKQKLHKICILTGSQLLKTEAFQETLTGSSKDFIGFSEGNTSFIKFKTTFNPNISV